MDLLKQTFRYIYFVIDNVDFTSRLQITSQLTRVLHGEANLKLTYHILEAEKTFSRDIYEHLRNVGKEVKIGTFL